jgi:hypothetical protein
VKEYVPIPQMQTNSPLLIPIVTDPKGPASRPKYGVVE